MSFLPDTQHIREHFADDLNNVRLGVYDPWIEDPKTAMAAIILMDQFSRNAYRGTPKAFELDSKAVTWAQHMLVSNMTHATVVLIAGSTTWLERASILHAALLVLSMPVSIAMGHCCNTHERDR